LEDSDQRLDFEIVNNKAKIGNDYYENFDLVEINGKIYIVDIGLTKVNLSEYIIIKKIERSFHVLNSEKKFARTFYIRIALVFVIIFLIFVPEIGFLNSLLMGFSQTVWLIIPTFFIIAYLGWTGWWGYIVFIIFLIIDTILGAIQGAAD
jgi:hypothetical protein